MRVFGFTGLASICALLAGAAFAQAAPTPAVKDVDALNYNGDLGGMHYSTLTQINPGNVSQLQQAWRYDLPKSPGDSENTPIMVGHTLYGLVIGEVYALDAATGMEKWLFKPPPPANPRRGGRGARGESWWSNGKEQRLFVTAGSMVYALDPATGKPISDFGDNGHIDLNANLRGDPVDNDVRMAGPVTIYKDMLFTNGGVPERTPASPGDIRAFDVHTGKLIWTFHTIPHPGEKHADTWPKDASLNLGGANDWAGAVLDAKRGILFEGTGSAADDYYGGERLGQNLYADSLLAINARTGRLLWYFQAVHHDLWDDDFSAPPMLITVTRNGKKIDAVAATNKTGFIYLFDRVTGKSLFPIHEVPVPPSTIPGDTAWPTQPEPEMPAPISRQTLTADELTQRTPEANAYARQKLATFLNGPQFTPPAYKQETVVAPGFSGGDEWGGMSYDPRQHYIFVNAQNIVWTTALNDHPADKPGDPPSPQPHSRYTFTGYNKFIDQDGYPATATPWGTLTAINADTGQFAWRVPFGEYPELVAQGVTNTGSENYGGGVATASGLFLIAATNFDRKLHAYDSHTGKLIWDTVLPYTGSATPMTYMVDGRQYVVINTSDTRDLKGPKGAALVAYALPQ